MENKIDGNRKRDKIGQIIADEKQITESMQRAVRDAVRVHKQTENPIAARKNGKAVLIEPKEIRPKF